MIVSAPEPPRMLSTFETVTVFVARAERQAVGAGAEIDGAVARAAS